MTPKEKAVELIDKERYYQDIFSATGKNGLNCKLTKSSDRSGEMSKETRKKMSEANSGKKHSEEIRNKMSIARKGIKLSEETKRKMSDSRKKNMTSEIKQKISESQKGRKHSEKSKLNMSKIILNIETGIFYYGTKEAAESINMKINTLRKKLNGTLKNKTSLIYI